MSTSAKSKKCKKNLSGTKNQAMHRQTWAKHEKMSTDSLNAGKKNPKYEEDAGNFHVWCENAAGDIIGDHTEFIELKMAQDIHRCHGEIAYKRWSPEREQAKWDQIQKTIREKIAKRKAINTIAKAEGQGFRVGSLWKQFETPVYQQCPYNASKFLIDEKKKGNHDVRICVGSMGWQKDDGTGVHWKWGSGD
jgi:hypothetical protein